MELILACLTLWLSGTSDIAKNKMVGWLEFNVPFQHKYGYITDER